MARLLPRKTVLEYRIKPELSFYSKLFGVGAEFLSKMETTHWACSGRSVEIKDFEQRRRVGLAFNRFFVELDGGNDQQESAVGMACGLLDSAIEGFSAKVVHVGLRQYFALDVHSVKEPMLVKKLLDLFGQPDFIGKTVDDVSYTFEIDSDDLGCRGRVICGAMNRKQWTQFVQYPLPDQPDSHITSESRDEIQKALPENFVFLDFDFIRIVSDDATIDGSELTEFAANAESENRLRARRLLNQLMG